MNAKTDTDVIEALDQLDRMNIDAARGIRDESELDQSRYTDGGKNATEVTVIYANEGIMIVSDRYEQLDIAWAGHETDLNIIDNLVNSGQLSRTK